MERVLVTGGTGMLGTYVHQALQKDAFESILADRTRFDLNRPDAIAAYIEELRPAAILHLAAETNVDLCEKEPAYAGLRNHLATQAVARAARNVGAWIAYTSTSNVFGAEGKLFYNELDAPAAVNYYGRSKLMGEIAIRAECPIGHLIVRPGWMIGGGPGRDHKFVGKIIEQIRKETPELKAVSDKYGTITAASQLSGFLLWALRARHTGTVNFASDGLVTRFDIASAIAQMLGYKGPVCAVESAQFPLAAPRPASEGIKSIYLSRLAAAPVPSSWRADLEKYVLEF